MRKFVEPDVADNPLYSRRWYFTAGRFARLPSLPFLCAPTALWRVWHFDLHWLVSSAAHHGHAHGIW